MGRLIYAIVFPVLLSACATVSGVANLPSALLDGYKYFEGSEAGLAHPMRLILAATQEALHRINMHVDILEHQENGYAMVFGGRSLDGKIRLVRVTEKLSTIQVSIVKKMIHQAALEQTVLNTIQNTISRISPKRHFIFKEYAPLLQETRQNAPRTGWYRRGAYVETKPSRLDGWVEVTLPSGQKSFLYLK